MRKEEQVKLLREEWGLKYVLNSTSQTFEEELDKVISELKPTVFFDYLAGDFPVKIFSKL